MMEKDILDILKTLKSDIVSIKSDVTSIKVTQNKHTQLLKALEHKTDVISADQTNLIHEAAEIKGDVKSIRKDLSNVEVITASNWSDIPKLKAVK